MQSRRWPKRSSSRFPPDSVLATFVAQPNPLLPRSASEPTASWVDGVWERSFLATPSCGGTNASRMSIGRLSGSPKKPDLVRSETLETLVPAYEVLLAGMNVHALA
jgi:hypothetical protein